MQVLHDWNSGKIPFYTPAPAPDAKAEAVASSSAAIVQSWSAEFDPEAQLSVSVEGIGAKDDDMMPLVGAKEEGREEAGELLFSDSEDEDLSEAEEGDQEASDAGGDSGEEDMTDAAPAFAAVGDSYDFERDFYGGAKK